MQEKCRIKVQLITHYFKDMVLKFIKGETHIMRKMILKWNGVLSNNLTGNNY